MAPAPEVGGLADPAGLVGLAGPAGMPRMDQGLILDIRCRMGRRG